jgi:hypothetical protein
MSDFQVSTEKRPFYEVPAEIIIEISTQLALVSTKGLASFRQTCRRFRDILNKYELSIVKDVMAYYSPQELERLELRLEKPSYPSMHKVVRRFATISWIMRGVSYTIRECCKVQPAHALARFEEGLKLMYTLSDESLCITVCSHLGNMIAEPGTASYDGKVEMLHKMSIASLVSLWLALYYCREEACDQGKGVIDGEHRDHDRDFRHRVESAFCEEILWKGPAFIYDTLSCDDSADM